MRCTAWVAALLGTHHLSRLQLLVFTEKKMLSKLLSLAPILVALFLIPHHGRAATCKANIPMVQQIQVGFGKPPKFMVVVQNSCPMCPAIDVHLKCAAFPQSLADPRVFRVVGYDDCVVDEGFPLAPLQKISFNYTHEMFSMSPKSWSFQCE